MLEDPLLTKPRKSLVNPRCKRVKDKPKPKYKQWTCQICDDIFSSYQEKLKHCNEEHKGHKVKCNDSDCNCNKLFKNRSGLKRHKKRSKAFVCKFCEATFSTKQERGEHCKNVHIYQYSCKQDDCGELFISWVDLVRHASQEHKYTKRWPCKFCDKSFSRNTVRRKHIKLIHEERLFKCTECSMQYKEKESLESHLNLLHNKKRWPCKFCDKSFSRNTVRRKHTKIIHEGKLFKCNECSMQYQEKESLESHELKYHKLTYPCIACNFVGESRDEIIFHKKKHEEECHTIDEKTPECGESDHFKNKNKIKLEQKENKMIVCESQFALKERKGKMSEFVREELPMINNEIKDLKSEKKPILIPESLMQEYEEKIKDMHAHEMLHQQPTYRISV